MVFSHWHNLKTEGESGFYRETEGVVSAPNTELWKW